MNNNLLIIGAGIYGLVAKDVAESMGCFERIVFADDSTTENQNGTPVVGTVNDLNPLSKEFANVVVAIGSPVVRQAMLDRIKAESLMRIATLVSSRVHVSPSAHIGAGCFIEPMAVVHTGCALEKGCLICAGGVVNHASLCDDCVQVDCNATIAGDTVVLGCIKIPSGTVYQNKKPHGSIPFDGREYSFEDGM